MAKISHYEVYTDTGSGWRLVSRFGAEDRTSAFNLAKDKENNKIPVKVIRETFDSSDGTYVESVEYIKGIKPSKPSYRERRINKKYINKAISTKINVKKTFQAFLTLIIIILLSAFFVNILGALLRPLLELILPYHLVKIVFFSGLFILFILIALPLVIHKVPWHDLSTHIINKKHITEDTFVFKASDIMANYALNEDFADDRTPMFPEASTKDKKQVIAMLAQVFSILSSYKMTDFNKLGIKLISYGAILQFVGHKKLKSSKLNSLLFEVISILDGKESDLVSFYQAKRSYKDNKTAVYLTGLGAFLMEGYLSKILIDKQLLKEGFEKWQEAGPQDQEPVKEILIKELLIPNIVTIKHTIKLFDSSSPKADATQEQQLKNIKNIISKLAQKFSGTVETDDNTQSSYLFADLAVGIAFAKQLLDDINIYIDDINDENIIFNTKINLIKKQDNNDNVLYIQDLFEYTNDDEILTTLNIVNEAKLETNLNFESIGKKLLPKTSKNVELFKVL